jgi:hypothetical protein
MQMTPLLFFSREYIVHPKRKDHDKGGGLADQVPPPTPLGFVWGWPARLGGLSHLGSCRSDFSFPSPCRPSWQVNPTYGTPTKLLEFHQYNTEKFPIFLEPKFNFAIYNSYYLDWDGSDSVSPPIFAGSSSVLWFCVSPPPRHENALGSLYIGVFRSSLSIWEQDGRHRRLEVQTSMGGMVWAGARATYARLGLVGPLVCFLFLFSCSFSKKK